MDFKEKYNKLVEDIKVLQKTNPSDECIQNWVKDNVPELAQSEDENIRKRIIQALHGDVLDMEETTKAIAWLEKQGQHAKFINNIQTGDQVTRNQDGMLINLSQLKRVAKPSEKQGELIGDTDTLDSNEDGLITATIEHANKVKPKFKVDEWVVTDMNNIVQIKAVNNGYYTIDNGSDFNMYYVDKCWHLWTIQDAKDGDVLAYVTDEGDLWIMIYQSLYEPYEGHVHYHALLVNDDFFDKGTCCICINDLKPATKEQRDLLFEKMKEAGYEWDAENKELKKIEQKPAWSEEDECYMGECIGAIATKDGWSFEEKRKTKHWLKSMKERCSWKPSDEQIVVLELASKYERVFTPKQIDILIGLKEQLKKLKGE